MWCLGTWFSTGLCCVRSPLGLSDLRGLLEMKQFYGSMIPEQTMSLCLEPLRDMIYTQNILRHCTAHGKQTGLLPRPGLDTGALCSCVSCSSQRENHHSLQDKLALNRKAFPVVIKTCIIKYFTLYSRLGLRKYIRSYFYAAG